MPHQHKGPRKPSNGTHHEEPADKAEAKKEEKNQKKQEEKKKEEEQKEEEKKEEEKKGPQGEAGGFKLDGYASFDIGYTLPMSLFHFYLAHHFVATVFLCEPTGCLQIFTFAHWLWVLQGLFYLFCILGRWIPALEIFALNWMIHPINGALFIAAFYTPGSSTLTALDTHWEGEHFFGSIGSFSGVYLPIVYFWVFLYCKRNQISLFLYDVQHRENSLELLVRFVYEIFSPFLVVIVWELLLRAYPHGINLEADMPTYPGTFWILGLVVLTNGILTLLLSAGTVFYKGHIVWVEFPRAACVLYEDPEVKGVLRIAAFQ